MNRTVIAPLAMAAAGVLLLASCGSHSAAVATTSAVSSNETSLPTSSSAPSSSVGATSLSSTDLTSPSPTSPSDVAKAQVMAFLPLYYATLDRLGASRTASLNAIDSIAIDPESADEKSALVGYRGNGWIAVGKTKLAAAAITSVTLPASANGRPVVDVTTCIDVSDAKEVDAKTGKAVGVTSRPNFFIEKLTVVNIKYPAEAGWRVSSAPNKGASSCAGV